MTVDDKYVSGYDRRVKMVAGALMQNSRLDEPAAVKLAAHVLQALDHIPEKVR